jgi:hypothetical protein
MPLPPAAEWHRGDPVNLKRNLTMTQIMKTLSDLSRAGLVACLALALPMLAQAEHHEEAQADAETSVRAMAMEAEAVITAIDLETREVTLQGSTGSSFTLQSQDKAIKLEDVKVGDTVVVTYLAALESQLREPTAEEIAEPWVELEEEVISDDAALPGIADMRVIRAVVTIEGMNREFGTVTIKDSRGKLHIIGRRAWPDSGHGILAGYGTYSA